MKIISGSSNPSLAQAIAGQLNLPLIDIEISRFDNGEKRIWVKDSVKGENIVLVQSFSEPTDEHILEFLLIADALERSGARHVNFVLPWMGYSRQDKVFRDGEPIAAKVIANIVSSAYLKRVFLLDIHNSSTPGFFSIPTQHLTALPLFVDYVKSHFPHLENFLVASPDFGGLKRARVFADKLQLPLINIDKHRDLHTGEIQSMGLQGEVAGKSVLIFDDMIGTGSTVLNATELLKKQGAKEVHFFATHGIFANNGRENIEKSAVDSVVVTNSIEQSAETAKIKVIDCSVLFGEAIAAWAEK
jgi:ribose-phosphate pyrophosphokinase